LPSDRRWAAASARAACTMSSSRLIVVLTHHIIASHHDVIWLVMTVWRDGPFCNRAAHIIDHALGAAATGSVGVHRGRTA
jgi:hypothetical protein